MDFLMLINEMTVNTDDMKRLFVAAAVILPLAIGCETEEPAGMQYVGDLVYKIFADVACLAPSDAELVQDEADTPSEVVLKSSFDGTDVVWQAGDAFSLFCADHANVKMILTKVTGSSDGMFAGRSDVPFAEEDTYYAVYPYSATASFSAESGIAGTFPAEQTDDGMQAVMVAKAESPAKGNPMFVFKKIFAVLEVSLTGDGETVTGLSFKGNDGEIVGGAFIVNNFDDPMPVFSGSEKEITMTLDEPVVLSAKPVTLKMMVPHMTFDDGYTVSVKTARSGNLEAVVTQGQQTIGHDIIYSLDYAVEVVPIYEWSKGYLTVDEDGYRFTDTDSPDGTESIGMFFRYNSAYAVEADLNSPDYDQHNLKVWYFNEESGEYESKTMDWADIPAEDAGDPCARVEVAAGERQWMMPTEDFWRTWAYKTTTYSAMVSYNQQDDRGVYAVYDTDPTDEEESPMYLFESKYITTNGGSTNTGWNSIWVASETGLTAGENLMYVQFKPSVVSNSANPAYKTVEVPESLATQGHQIRCIRRVN